LKEVEVVEEAAGGGRSWKMLKKVDKSVVKMEVYLEMKIGKGDESGWRRWK
jgi:hypothetical protein